MKTDSPLRAGIEPTDLVLVHSWQQCALGIATAEEISAIGELTGDHRTAAAVNSRAAAANRLIDEQLDCEKTADLRQAFARADKVFAKEQMSPQVRAIIGRSSEGLLRQLCAARLGASKS